MGGVYPERSEWGELVSQDDSFHHGVHPECSRGDGMGNTERITNGAGSETVNYHYRAFGQPAASAVFPPALRPPGWEGWCPGLRPRLAGRGVGAGRAGKT